jgi:hypothetical protein
MDNENDNYIPLTLRFDSRDEALDYLIGKKGNDYTNAYGHYNWKTEPDTFGDGPYYIEQVPNGKWRIA